MQSKQLDQHLLNLAWSLWTELGVAGVKQNHQDVLILVEELVLLTSILADEDPRLRDESLDWCSQFHHFISTSRLKVLIKNFGELLNEPFYQYAATLNAISSANWPNEIQCLPIQFRLSHKSVLRPHASAALLNIRARSIFGTGARADLVTFFLVHPNSDFSVAEAAEIGYSKRNIAEVLDDLHHFGNLFSRYMQGNQHRYRLNKNSPLEQILQPIPKSAPSWHLIFKILLSLRACIKRTENDSESTKVVEIRNCLATLEGSLQKLRLAPPPFQNNFPAYLESFSKWILEYTALLAEGNLLV